VADAAKKMYQAGLLTHYFFVSSGGRVKLW